MRHKNTENILVKAEMKALEGLEKDRKIATEMGQIPETLEPEETARDNRPSPSAQNEREKIKTETFS